MRRIASIVALLMATFTAWPQQRFVKTFDTVAALLAANPNDLHTVAIIKGYASASEAGGNILKYDPASVEATNATTVFKPNNFNGRWLTMGIGDYSNPTFGTNFTVGGITYNFPLTNYTSGQFLSVITNGTNVYVVGTNLPTTTVVFDTIEELVATPVPTPGISLFGIVRDSRRDTFVFLPNSVEETNNFWLYPTPGTGRWRRLSYTGDIRLEWGTETGGLVTNATLVAALTLQSAQGYGRVVFNGAVEFSTNAVPLLDNNVLFFEDGAQATGLVLSANLKTNVAVYGGSFVAAVASPSTGAFYLTNSVVLLQSPKFTGYSGSTINRSGTNAISIFTFDANGMIVDQGPKTSGDLMVWQNGGTNKLALKFDGTFDPAIIAGTTINPTDGYLPYRSNATTFGNSPWYRISTNAMGFNSTLKFLFSDSQNIGLGRNALNSITSGTANVAVGDSAGDAITTGSINTAIGNDALGSQTVGGGNVAIGDNALKALNNAGGVNNVAVGAQAGFSATSGAGSVFIGVNAGHSQTTAVGNTVIGGDAGYYNMLGWGTIVGYGAGAGANDLTESVIVGSHPFQSGESTTRSFTKGVWIGAKLLGSLTNWTSVDNAIVIGSSVIPRASNTAQIGTNGIAVLYLNGTVGWFRGSGSPEGVVTASIGSYFTREDGGAGTSLYVKESGAGNTGWVALTTGSGTPGITGSGTANQVMRWLSSGVATNSSITDNGTTVAIPLPITANSITVTNLATIGSIATPFAGEWNSTYFLPGVNLLMDAFDIDMQGGDIDFDGGYITNALTATFGGAATVGGGIDFLEPVDNGTSFIRLKAPNSNLASSYTNTLTAATGTVPLLESAQTWTGINIFTNATYPAVFLGGNVGIGTNAPTHKLEVVGISTSEPNLMRIIRNNPADNTEDSMLTLETAGAGDPVLKFLLTGDTKFTIGIDNSDGDKFKISKASTLGAGGDCFFIDSGLAVGILAGQSTSFAKLGGTLKSDTTTTGNVGAGEDNLISYSVPAYTMGVNGDYLEFDVWGTFAANVNTAQLKIYFGATVILDTTSLIFNGIAWRGHGKIVRTSTSTQEVTCEFTVGGTLLSAVNSTITSQSNPAEALSGAVIFKVTGQDTGGVPADNKVVQKAMVLKWNPGN